MLTVVQILAVLSALLHGYIFVLESLRFAEPKVYAGTFHVEREDLTAVQPWAFNQGWYNLFLAIGTLIGALLLPTLPQAGWALLLIGCGSMIAAAGVLVANDRRFVKAALIQGTLPALALITGLTTQL
ncbi:putative membrane protein [Nocardia amikacinitolerans]|uniref:Putative membrane protein n=1 Tax=Nocardia amikacinitolerans TaxID=756689 RepID=A0A285KPY5_9NOCA|nr:DUF1304 domain-containing protein [Nocardia amikacinitolerans]MCP2275464.1 putative membrane protein [Nocardia amikacinitolerans]MCP2293724.1 putative membrane protein [Nocardia amikacinitolerans]MCP2315363.1 putative membrane protein [Nocardia amikacinitolerans]SNY74670.1 putative membrane protein [Nocardia amikacinitolerans]